MADKKISQLTNATTPLTGVEVLPVVQGGTTVKVSVDNLTAGKAVSAANYTAVRDNIPFRGQLSLQTSSATNFAQITLYDRTTLGAQIYQAYDVVDGVGDFFVQTATASNLFLGTNGTARARIGATSGDVTALSGNFVVGTAGKGIDFSANANAPGMTSEVLTWYEEGVFTLTDSGVKDAVLGTWTFVSGTYTRIGRQVTINATFSGTGLGFSANTGYYRWDGLPFASAATHSGTWQGIEAFKACAGFAFTAASNIWLHAAITTQTSDSGIVLTATYTV